MIGKKIVHVCGSGVTQETDLTIEELAQREQEQSIPATVIIDLAKKVKDLEESLAVFFAMYLKGKGVDVNDV